MCRPAGVGSAGLRPAAGPGVMPLGTVRSLRLTAVSTSRSAPLSHDARAHPSSHEGVGVPTGCLAGPVSAERQRGQRGPGATLTCGTLCALHPCGNLRNPSIAAVFRSSLASCRHCRVTAPGLSVPGVPTRARGSTSERAAKEPHPRGAARWPLPSGPGFQERREEVG